MGQVLRNGKGDRVPPLTPDAFEKLLEEGVASGEIKFTGDVALVARIYRAAFLTEMGAATVLNWS